MKKRFFLSTEKFLTPIFNAEGGLQEPATRTQDVPINKLINRKDQPRKLFKSAELEELAQSIKEHGILQPPLVRRIGESYEIIAGERRWRAAQIAGLEFLPVTIKDSNEKQVSLYAIIENVQREDLNPMEEALAYSQLINNFELTHESIAKQVGKSRTTITNSLRLLKLDPVVQDFVMQDKLEMGHARALLALTEYEQIEVAQKVIEKSLSVRETEKLIREKNVIKQKPSNFENKNMFLLEDSLLKLRNQASEKLKLPIEVKKGSRNRVNVIFDCVNEKQAEWLLEKF